MSKNTKIILGILSILPFIMLPVFLIYLFTGFIPDMIELDQMDMEPDPVSILGHLGGFIAMAVVFGMLSFGMLIYFIVHVATDGTAAGGDRVLWILLLVFFGQLVFPFYWFFRIWTQKSVERENLSGNTYTN